MSEKTNSPTPVRPPNPDDISPMPDNGQQRIAALKNLGGTFKEGKRSVTKIATPTSSDTIPSFMDTKRIEELLKQKTSKSLEEAGHEALADQ
ncbi:hypothetical protein BJV82DRAFT_669962 [Fennellomyces sp. T-0311]|nr:hypothetical protein BJV82DRAFT_669962 [Fennellomyces sp. T-0311]